MQTFAQGVDQAVVGTVLSSSDKFNVNFTRCSDEFPLAVWEPGPSVCRFTELAGTKTAYTQKNNPSGPSLQVRWFFKDGVTSAAAETMASLTGSATILYVDLNPNNTNQGDPFLYLLVEELGPFPPSPVTLYTDKLTFQNETGGSEQPLPSWESLPVQGNDGPESGCGEEINIPTALGNLINVTAPNASPNPFGLSRPICICGPACIINNGPGSFDPDPPSSLVAANGEDDYEFVFDTPVLAFGLDLVTNNQANETLTIRDEMGNVIAQFSDAELETQANQFEFIGVGSTVPIGSIGLSNTGGAQQNEGFYGVLVPGPSPLPPPTKEEVLDLLSELRRSTRRDGPTILTGQFVGYLSGQSMCPNGVLVGDPGCPVPEENVCPFDECFEDEIDDLATATGGDHPAIIGADYGFPVRDANGDPLDSQGQILQVNGFLKGYVAQGGLATVSWHAENPWGYQFADEPLVSSKVEPSVNQCDRCFVRTKAMPDWRPINRRRFRGQFDDFANELTQSGSSSDPDTTAAVSRWLEQLDEVAEGLRDLGDVPVLWRPFHEMNGDWFWWGSQRSASFRKVWHHMFTYFTETKGLENLIWVFSPDWKTGEGSTIRGVLDVLRFNPCINGRRNVCRGSSTQYIDVKAVDFYPTDNSQLTRPPHRAVSFQPPARAVVGLGEFGTRGPLYVTTESLLDSVVENAARAIPLVFLQRWHYPNSFIRECELFPFNPCIALDDDRLITREDLPGLIGN